jgi:5-methylcytosine-specific restriction endonuclease McrA
MAGNDAWLNRKAAEASQRKLAAKEGREAAQTATRLAREKREIAAAARRAEKTEARQRSRRRMIANRLLPTLRRREVELLRQECEQVLAALSPPRRICFDCGEARPLDAFYPNSRPNYCRECCNTRKRDWERRNLDKIREKNRAGRHRRNAAKRGSARVETVRKSVVWKRDQGICGICGLAADPEAWDLEHIVPLARQGDHTYANTRVSHPACNAWKRDRLDSELPTITPMGTFFLPTYSTGG